MGIYVKRARRNDLDGTESRISGADSIAAKEEALARLRTRLEGLPIPGDQTATIEWIMRDARRHFEDYEDVLNEGHFEVTVPQVLVGDTPHGTVRVSSELTELTGVRDDAEPYAEFEGRRVRLRMAFADNLREYQMAISKEDSVELQYRSGKGIRLSFDEEDIQDGLMQLKFTGDETREEIRDMVTMGYSESVNRRRAGDLTASTGNGSIPRGPKNPMHHSESLDTRVAPSTRTGNHRHLNIRMLLAAMALIAVGLIVLLVVLMP